MRPGEFLSKWRNVELKERSASQSHFNDLCMLLGVLDPVSADPTGEWFTFEKGATKTGGGEGWADVWRRGCFGWEYKGKHANLDKALAQLLQYSVALESPPLLIVSDMDLIRVHTNFTNTVQEVHRFTLDDLLDGAKRDRLKQAFTDPEAFKPAKTRQALTEETAREFAGIAQRLRDRGHEAHQVAHFVNQLVFCMFAEDVGLLPDQLFTKMLEVSRRDPAGFEENARTLFGAMAHKGGKVGFTAIDWFNGGLFTDDHVLPVSTDDIDELLSAARRDWSQIDPSILGTLFERGLDPAKRSQLGAHYTDRAKIMMIVKPVIIEPLEAEWAEALAKMTALVESAPKRTAERLLTPAEKRKADRIMAAAAAIHSAFIERLAKFRVLDPACGSGNFLYVALRSLKDIEHRANLDAEALGLPRGFPRTGPENVLGIELNPYAAELARVSVWIGEIQWMRRNGFDAAKNPILRPLDTIECRDAVLNEDGTRAAWPEADVVVGNPPFLGDKRMLAALGREYTGQMRAAYSGQLAARSDLVAYWFEQALRQMQKGKLKRAGFVSTNSIRQQSNRGVLEKLIKYAPIFEAWSDEPWAVDGASVRVSLICFEWGVVPLLPRLDGGPVDSISSDLTGANRIGKVVGLPQNQSVAFQGIKRVGQFEIPRSTAVRWLLAPANPNGRKNSDVLRPWASGFDVVRRPQDFWIIDYGWDTCHEDAALYELPFAHVEEFVRPERRGKREARANEMWWIFYWPRPEMRRRLRKVGRYLARPSVSKHHIFRWFDSRVLPDGALVVVCREDDTAFGILQSRVHELWGLARGSTLEDRPAYTPSTTFETFPFPDGLTPDIPAADSAADPRAQAIAAAAAELNRLRENWLNPADLVVREPEVVPGYPDRILPRDEAAAREMKKRTLTNLYNARPQWLANAHDALDAAVADAYGWGEDWRSGALTDEEILARLFALNQERMNARTASA
jgi:type II restriction/modification system DNA methylase subunit YeeA